MKAIIYSVGTEILLGSILDTNSKFIAERLQELGINLYKMETVGDNPQRLYDALKEADGEYDYVFVSGGLGPTEDDISKETAVKVCGLEDELVLDDKSYQDLKDYFKERKESLPINKKQAVFPKSATILKNDQGTAPGCMMTSQKGTVYALLPGPPAELRPMFDKELAPRIKTGNAIKSINAKIGLLGESDVARMIDLSGSDPTISPYAKSTGVELRITASGSDVESSLKRGLDSVKKAFGDLLISTEEKSREEILIDELRKNNETVMTAESITGGMVASFLVNIPGASEVLKEGLVVYSNEAKHKYLNVSYETIDKYDVVSEEVVRQMLDGMDADLNLATTGYAHEGIAYLGVSYKGQKFVRKIRAKGDRNKVRRVCKNKIIDMSILIVRGVYDNISI